ncbi:hypothetical protein ACFZAD_24645 [Streptomyces iakyrus]|uniref:hypothetical protein n=1 Tax=Streptomyces iakyrus TaxID=68219 RepID=UPI0036E1A4C6
MPFGELLAQYGLPGIIIFALGGAVLVLYAELKQERAARKADTEKLYERYIALQETRRTEDAEKSERVTETMANFTETTKLLIDKIIVAKRKG